MCAKDSLQVGRGTQEAGAYECTSCGRIHCFNCMILLNIVLKHRMILTTERLFYCILPQEVVLVACGGQTFNLQ